MVNEICKNPAKYGLAGEAKKLERIRGMLKPGIATYVIIFQAAANYFQLNFVLYFGFEQPLVFASKQRKNAVNVRNFPSAFILCKGQGCHFNPLSRHSQPKNLLNCYLLEYDPFLLDMPEYEEDEFIDHLNSEFTLNEIVEILKPCPEQPLEDIANAVCLSAMNPPLSISESAISCLSESFEAAEKSITVRLPRYHSLVSCPHTDSLHHFCGEMSFKLRKPLNVLSSVSRGAETPGNSPPDSDHAKIFADNYEELYLCVFIDTGSTISLLSETAYKILYLEGFAEESLPLKQGHGKIKTIDGSVTAKEVVMLTVPFWSPSTGHTASHLFYIPPDKYCTSCLLLGADFMSSYNIKMSYDQNVFNDNLPQIGKQCGNTILYPNVRESNAALQFCNSIFVAWPYHLMACLEPLPATGLIPEDIRLNPGLMQALIKANKNDQEIKQVMQAVKENNKHLCPELYVLYFPKLVLLEGFLFYEQQIHGEIPIMPVRWATEMAMEFHEDMNHIGSTRLWLVMKDMCWHPKMRDIINEICKTCPLCQIMKAYTSIRTPPIHKVVVQRPFDLVCLDVLTLPKTKLGYNYVLVISDHCSKFLTTFPMKNHTTDTIISLLEQYLMSIPSCVKTLLTDSAPELASDKFKQFCEKRDIYHMFSSPYISWTNGFAERNCGLVIQHLKFVLNSIENWDQELYRVVIAHNNSPSLPTLMSPNEFLMSKPHLKNPDGVLTPKVAAKW